MNGTSDHTAGNWKSFYSDGSGDIIELSLGSANTFFMSNGELAPTYTASTGTANVVRSASPTLTGTAIATSITASNTVTGAVVSATNALQVGRTGIYFESN